HELGRRGRREDSSASAGQLGHEGAQRLGPRVGFVPGGGGPGGGGAGGKGAQLAGQGNGGAGIRHGDDELRGRECAIRTFERARRALRGLGPVGGKEVRHVGAANGSSRFALG